MSRMVFLDAGPLGMYANPKKTPKNEACRQRVNELIVKGIEVRVPEIAEYEVRRELIHLQLRDPKARRLKRFDAVVMTLGRKPFTPAVFPKAQEVWAQARYRGIATAGNESLDGDAILIAQALLEIESGNSVEIATTNPKHLKDFVTVLDWQDLKT